MAWKVRCNYVEIFWQQLKQQEIVVKMNIECLAAISINVHMYCKF